ncbi:MULTISPECIES: ATP-binding protein [Halomonadaceae]|uniref:histidine kinase n=1 Tax=Vreelandella subterranea TaxID=416874 RepID=A0A1H9RCK6_9GAMM|nr:MULTISPECIES: ATP-binding protein [Halomonas]MCO7248132.1 ATP-binding protein [Halomonas sp. Mc5H-6]MDR5884990.1 ATP-binding protein [Halomonas janggokensis]SER70367.1 Signal transduction histidine kinase [Halomonas subterranea]
MFHVNKRSLQFRLLAWLGGVALLVVGLTWLLHGVFLQNLAKDFLGERLKREADHAVAQLEQDRLAVPTSLASTSEAYQVFHHLYVLRLNGEISASDPVWQRQLAPLLNGKGDALIEVTRGERHLLVYRQHFEWQGANGVLLIGEDFSQVEAGLATLHWWVGGIAAGMLAVLVTLNMLAVNRGLRPLWQLRYQLEALQAGDRQRLSLKAPDELDALVAQLNRFMDDIDLRLKRSRESVANLSHALKTPLAAVTQVLSGNRPIDENRRRKLLMRIEDINAQLDAELRRARIAGPHAGRMTHLTRDSQRLMEMFRSLYSEQLFELTQAIDARDQVPIDAHDYAEILGIVLDNAGKWATSEIRCHISTSSDALTLTIDDDGPGVAESDMVRLGERGTRLDEHHPGYGLGLAILSQLVARYHGRCQFEHSPLGGLRVITTLPMTGVTSA